MDKNQRKDRLIKDCLHDPYFVKADYKEPAQCNTCGVFFNNGRFLWETPAQPIKDKITCPACQRIHEKVEGGTVKLTGDFLQQHRDEIMNLIHNVEQEEKNQRPLERIMAINKVDDGYEITVTYEHIGRRIGDAVHRAYNGKLSLDYPTGEKYIRVHWCRD